jgi:hypothetical protein
MSDARGLDMGDLGALPATPLGDVYPYPDRCGSPSRGSLGTGQELPVSGFVPGAIGGRGRHGVTDPTGHPGGSGSAPSRSLQTTLRTAGARREQGQGRRAAGPGPSNDRGATLREEEITMPRYTRLAAAAAAASLVLTACGGGGDADGTGAAAGDGETSGEQVTLNLWTFGNFGYDDLIEEYQDENPNVRIETLIQEFDPHHDALITSLAAGTGGPDIAAAEVAFIGAFTNQPDSFVNLLDYGAADLQRPLPRLEVGPGHDAGRLGDHRAADRRRWAGDLLPDRPVRGGRAADRPRRGLRAVGRLVGGLHHGRQAVQGGHGSGLHRQRGAALGRGREPVERHLLRRPG